MKKHSRLIALVLAAALFIPGAFAADIIKNPIAHISGDAAVDITTKVALQEQSVTAIRAIILANAGLVLDAREKADPVRSLLEACWNAKPNSFKHYPDLEAFAAENALPTANLLRSDEVQAAAAAAQATRNEQARLEAQRIAAGLAAAEEARLAQERLAKQNALDYGRAALMKEMGLFDEAAALFLSLGDYQDAPQQARECQVVQNGFLYMEADELMKAGSFLPAYRQFAVLAGLGDADIQAQKALLAFIASKKEAALSEYAAATGNYASLNELIAEMNSLESIPGEALKAYHGALMEVATAALEGTDHRTALKLLEYLALAGYEGAAKALRSAQALASAVYSKEAEALKEARALETRVGKITGGAYPFFILNRGTVSGPAAAVYPGSAAWRDVADAGSNLFYAAALHGDGTVSLAPNPRFYGEEGKFDIPLPEVSGWRNVKSISVGAAHLAGIDNEGNILFGGSNSYGQTGFPELGRYTAVSAGRYHTLLKRDNTVIGYGSQLFNQLSLNSKAKVDAVAAGAYHSLALLPNGTVRAAGLNADGQCEVREWEDVKAIAAGDYHSVALKRDGTVVAAGANSLGQCDVGDWAGVVSIAAGSGYTIGLQEDGTVLSTAKDGAYGLQALSAWTSLPPTQWRDMSLDASMGRYDFSGMEVGSLVSFGKYEQDNDPANGMEPIEWRVLAIEDGRALLVSEKALDSKPYNTKMTAVLWEKSSLRAWLNSDFLASAFTEEEQGAILNTAVDNTNNAGFRIGGGPDTNDQVFLLSIEEAETYLVGEVARRLLPTDYALARKAFESNGRTAWWLRSPGASKVYAAYVSPIGQVSIGGVFVNTDNRAVRPALYINLDSTIF